MIPLVENIKINQRAMLEGFKPDVFAADYALSLAGKGMPFRDAYRYVKEHLHELANMNPREAISRKRHLGATAGLNLNVLNKRRVKEQKNSRNERTRFYRSISRLLGVEYPLKERQKAE